MKRKTPSNLAWSYGYRVDLSFVKILYREQVSWTWSLISFPWTTKDFTYSGPSWGQYFQSKWRAYGHCFTMRHLTLLVLSMCWRLTWGIYDKWRTWTYIAYLGSPKREQALSLSSSRYVLYLESTIAFLIIIFIWKIRFLFNDTWDSHSMYWYT